MSRRPLLGRGCQGLRTWWGLAVAALVVVTVVHERGTVERANRLHRDRAWNDAATIYRGHLGARPGDAGLAAEAVRAREVRYNLGTSLLALGSTVDAEANIQEALESLDEEVRVRATYNLGVGRLLRAVEAPSADSAMVHATVALEANKEVLRVRPGDEAAAWNLAFAQRMLDSLDIDASRSGVQAGGDMDDAELVESPTTGDAAAEEVQQPPTASGEDETVAQAGDAGPMSLAEAAAILATMRLDGAPIIRKLLALEGRGRLGLRRGSANRRW